MFQTQEESTSETSQLINIPTKDSHPDISKKTWSPKTRSSKSHSITPPSPKFLSHLSKKSDGDLEELLVCVKDPDQKQDQFSSSSSDTQEGKDEESEIQNHRRLSNAR